MIVRMANHSDLQELVSLSASVSGGMTTLPRDALAWERKLDLVAKSLSEEYQTGEALYFLVLEDTETGKIAGTASVHAGVGTTRPFYNYKLSRHVKSSSELGIQVVTSTLNLVNDFTGDTELGSLFLRPEYRGASLGRFLSMVRFLLMSEFPERFSDRVFAEIRGWLDESGESPFWEHLGRKFFNLSYEEADSISAVHGVQFISDLMPQHPVYLELLPESARAVIGVPHCDSVVAMKYMLDEGFRYQTAVDIFDAGPVLECDRSHIRSLGRAANFTVAEATSSESEENDMFLVSNGAIDNYRVILTRPSFTNTDELTLSKKALQELGLQVGCRAQLLKLR